MHLAAYCHNFPPHPGGLEAIVEALARAQVASGHRVTLVTTAWEGSAGRELEEGVEVHRLPALHATERWGVPYPVPVGRGLRAAARATSSAEIHHAHGCLYPTTLLARRAARRCATPLVITEHVGFVPYGSVVVNTIQAIAWRIIGDRALAAASFVVAYNERVRAWLERRLPGRGVEFIPNGIDLGRFRPPAAGEREAARCEFGLPPMGTLALFAGRAAAKKNLEGLLRVSRVGFRLVCCGAQRTLPRDVIDLGLLPFDRMPALYRAVDFFIHLGVGEGFPVAVQEAAASGLPLLLLWDEGYRTSIARDDVLALDSLSQLADGCSRLATSASLRRELAERSRLQASVSWSWDRTRESYEQLYKGTSVRPSPGQRA